MLEGTTLWELIDARVAATPDARLAIDENDRTLTFAEFAAAAERAAAGLAAMGIGEGDVVSWQLPTWLESLTLVAALSRLGAVQNPMLPIYREKEVGFIARQANAKLLVVPGEWRGFDFTAMAEAVAADLPDCRVLVVDTTTGLPEGDPVDLPAKPAAGGPAEDQPVRWLFYTSGTTADPKGAQHTDASIAAVGKGMAERLALVPEDRNGMVFPFTHIGGITWLFSSLQVGNCNIFLEAFHPVDTPETLSRNDATVCGAGTIFHQTYLTYQREHPDTRLFPSVRVFPGGGAPKPVQLFHDMKEVFGAPILSGYGLTEAPILTMAATTDTDEELATSEGKPMPGVALKLVRLDGQVAAPGEEGEIRAKAPQLMKGYLDSSLDAEAFDDEGYFRTGDLGRLDAGGNVVITGRLKDIIIRKGENVSAKEVEDHLYKHPAIADVAVIGLPDPASGERVCAVVATKPGETLTFEEMVEFLRNDGLMNQKLPEQLEVIDTVPRNPSGKILKHELRARFGD